MGSMRSVNIAALLALSGCSLGISGPDPERPKNQPPQCDTGKGLVAADAVMAGLLGLIGISIMSGNSDQGAGVVPMLGGVAFAASAIRGSGNVDACRLAMDEYASGKWRQQFADDKPAPAVEAPLKVSVAPVVPPPVAAPAPAPVPPATTMHMRAPEPPPAAPAWKDFWQEVTP